MNSQYHGIWLVLYEWQTLVSGGLAIFAALIAYRMGRRQASALEKQNAEMREREYRTLNRETKMSASLLVTVLRIFSTNIEDTIKDFEQNWRPEPFRDNWKPQKTLYAPPLYPALNQLVKLDLEVMQRYFEICTRVSQFRAQAAPVRDDLIHQLREILITVRDLLQDVEQRYDKT